MGFGMWVLAALLLYATVPPFVGGLNATLSRRATDVDLPVNFLTSLLAIIVAAYLARNGWEFLRAARDPFAREDVLGEMKPRWKEFRYSLHLLRKSLLAMVGLTIIIVYVGIAILGPFFAPFPYEFSGYEKHVAPGTGAMDTQTVFPGNFSTTMWTDANTSILADKNYSSSATVGDVLYLTNISVPLVFRASTVQALDVGIQYYSPEGQSLAVALSWDRGGNWTPDQVVPFKTTDDLRLWYLSFTGGHPWTSSELGGGNVWMRVTHVQGSGPAVGTVYVEHAVLRAVLVGPIHPWGTNELGEDVLSGILLGAGTDLRIGVLTVFGAVAIGIVLGVFSGYLGRVYDEVIMRITDMFLAVPGLILALAFVAILGRSLNNVLIALMLVSWPGYTRLVRGQVLTVREVTYVEAARAVGAPTRRIVMRHILPNVIAVVIVAATLDLGTVVIGTAALSFLGLGAQPYEPEWGIMIARGYGYMVSGFWWEYIPPGIAILLFVLAFNLFGDGLRDILDPRLRR